MRVDSSPLGVHVEGVLGSVNPTLGISNQTFVRVLRLCEAVIKLGVVTIELVNDLHLRGP